MINILVQGCKLKGCQPYNLSEHVQADNRPVPDSAWAASMKFHTWHFFNQLPHRSGDLSQWALRGVPQCLYPLLALYDLISNFPKDIIMIIKPYHSDTLSHCNNKLNSISMHCPICRLQYRLFISWGLHLAVMTLYLYQQHFAIQYYVVVTGRKRTLV